MQNNISEIGELLTACKAGSQKAQLDVYNRYCHAMFNTAYRVISDVQEAENIMQDAFLAAFTKLDKYNGKFSFGAWLKRIVINKSISHLRNKKKYYDLFETTIDISANDIQDEEIYLKEENIKEVIKQINNLKENYKIALNLNLIEGYDYDEMAEILGISNQYCRTTVSRAKSKLRELIEVN